MNLITVGEVEQIACEVRSGVGATYVAQRHIVHACVTEIDVGVAAVAHLHRLFKSIFDFKVKKNNECNNNTGGITAIFTSRKYWPPEAESLLSSYILS